MQNGDMTQKLCLPCKGQLYIEAITNTDLEQNLEPERRYFLKNEEKEGGGAELGVGYGEAGAGMKENKT